MEPVYAAVNAVVLSAHRAMGWRRTVVGAEHVPTTGGAVIATNHIGYLDFTFIGYGARERGRLVRFFAKKEIFDKPGAGHLMRGMKHIPVDRYGRAQDSYARGLAALARGEIIGMFPEGTISTSFVPGRGKTGAARMAMAAGVPLVPGAVWGSQRLLAKGRPRNLQRGVPITISFGAPIPYDVEHTAGAVTDRLMSAIAEQVQRAAATYPDAPAGPEDAWWLPAHLGGTAPTVQQARAEAESESRKRRARRRAQRALPP